MRRLLARSAPFSYSCGGCGRCCHDKRIALSVYEIARLAEARGTSTTQILAHHTDAQGTVLRFGEDGCTFLESGQCTVHTGRPLACRLYPLGRYVHPNGAEAFVEVEPHPETAGIYGDTRDTRDTGTVAAWVEQQGATPYIEAAQKTFVIFEKLLELVDDDAVGEALEASHGTIASEWLDVDAVVGRLCAERGQPVPSSLEERFTMHLEALERWVESHRRAGDAPTSPSGS